MRSDLASSAYHYGVDPSITYRLGHHSGFLTLQLFNCVIQRVGSINLRRGSFPLYYEKVFYPLFASCHEDEAGLAIGCFFFLIFSTYFDIQGCA